MFGRKKKKAEAGIPMDITKFSADWEKDFQFLNFIMQRKKSITRNFLVDVVTSQKEKDTYLTDAELEPIIERSVLQTMESISGAYKEYLILKYFGEEKNLLSFIVEDFYVDLTSYAVNKNSEKIKKIYSERMVEQVSELNRRISAENN